MKRLLSIIVAILIALTFAACGEEEVKKYTSSRKEKEDKSFSVSIDKTSAEAGRTVKVPIKIKNNDGIFLGNIIVNYDTDDMIFVSYSAGEVFDMCFVNDNSGSVSILLEMEETEETKLNGTVITLEFEVKADASKGKSILSLDSNTEFINGDNYAVEAIKPKLKNGEIFIK